MSNSNVQRTFTPGSEVPMVTVIVPAYNEENYISKTLYALINQYYPNFEVIVIDNGSTDATAKKVEEFISCHFFLAQKIQLVYEGRRGTQFAREKGRSLAKGKIIAQLDADCIPESNWIAKGVYRLWRENVVAVTGPYDYFDSPFYLRILTLCSQTTILKFLNSFVQWMKKGAIIIGGNCFIKADILERAGGYNTSLTFYGDDVDIALRTSKFGSIVYANSLTLKTSSRRYQAMGFANVQKKYSRHFFHAVIHGSIDRKNSAEVFHPR